MKILDLGAKTRVDRVQIFLGLD